MKTITLLFFIFLSVTTFSQPKPNVKTGDQIIDFKVRLVNGEETPLQKFYGESPLVLIVLRGWPEYQCPICSRQVGEFIIGADQFKMHNANVLMIYPGPSDILQEKAKEFTADFEFPESFYFAIDPSYEMVNKYGLRWDAEKETAYPSTFVINKEGKVVYSKVSTTHGDRASLEEVIEALDHL